MFFFWREKENYERNNYICFSRNSRFKILKNWMMNEEEVDCLIDGGNFRKTGRKVIIAICFYIFLTSLSIRSNFGFVFV